MKRNWTALALALGLTLTLTACGGNPGAAETPGSAAPTGSQTPAAESDLDYVKGNGVLKIGYTLFEPMNYLGEDGELTGFETEFATAVCAKLGVEPKFVEINWDAKLLELESKNIDCIWNGMTITPELQEAISISDPYIKNYQVVVIRAADADKYTSTESLAGANLDAEAGSGCGRRVPQPGQLYLCGEADRRPAGGQERSGGRGGDGLRAGQHAGRHRRLLRPDGHSRSGAVRGGVRHRLPPGLRPHRGGKPGHAGAH